MIKEETIPTEVSKNTRRQRRAYLKAMGYLKIKNEFGRFSAQGKTWYDRMCSDGKTEHLAHERRVQDQHEEQLGQMAESLKVTWRTLGYNDSELEMLSEAFFILALSNTREDRKTARKLMKDAKTTQKSRLNAIR